LSGGQLRSSSAATAGQEDNASITRSADRLFKDSQIIDILD
jgi:hypothetical protein